MKKEGAIVALVLEVSMIQSNRVTMANPSYLGEGWILSKKIGTKYSLILWSNIGLWTSSG